MRQVALALLSAAALLLAACAGVTVHPVSPGDYLAQRRGDILTTGALSAASQDVLRVIGLTAKRCRREAELCHRELAESGGISDEQRYATLAELWLQHAFELDAAAGDDPLAQDRATGAWLETARHATAYLFFTGRKPGQRAFEDRQTQVRDYYNFATQKAVTAIFARTQAAGMPRAIPRIDGWQIDVDTADLQQRPTPPRELVAASSLRFSGLRNVYRRDGFGAELVAVLARAPKLSRDDGAGAPPYREMPYPVVTVLLHFDGDTRDEIMAAHRVQIVARDPYRHTTLRYHDEELPLAANFTAGYGLWLARSGFARQAFSTLFGWSDGIDRPTVYLMQPYDRERRVVIMLHGLASSPEAWINVANEVLGDETLRQHYQIWQVYYPTSVPLSANNLAIHRAIADTLAHFDPDGTAPASQQVTLIGHSMGGVLARLMVSSSGETVWNDFLDRYEIDAGKRAELQRSVGPYTHFTALPQIGDAIFIAAPHRGTPAADQRLARWAANLIGMPLTMLQELGDLSRQIAQLQPRKPSTRPRGRIPNGIDNLSDRDDFIRITSTLPIAATVQYHSIIGNDTPERPLAESSDGLVPYASAHLDGAASELVIKAGHSVQEHPRAILEIRRILREQLAES